VLGKKADLRHRAATRTDLPPLQSEILSAAATYVKVGGVLLYTTCTLSRKENEAVACAFAQANPAFAFEDFSVGKLPSQDGMLTLLPHRHGTDGFFIAKFRKQD
jgi:16S rRNA (cytosine967-C5)-methyltransferase